MEVTEPDPRFFKVKRRVFKTPVRYYPPLGRIHKNVRLFIINEVLQPVFNLVACRKFILRMNTD